MFDALSDRLDAVFSRFRGSRKLTEDQVKEGLREIRVALLEADVNFRVVKTFTTRVKERAVGEDISEALTSGQQLIKIVNEELVRILGEQSASLDLGSSVPAVIMLAGLQGAGKTTAAGKLAMHLKNKDRKPMLVACDLQRPAAVRQLQILGERVGVPVYAPQTEGNPVDVANNAVNEARRLGRDVVIVDTAGRTNVDEEMMAQASAIKAAVNPVETLFVIDAMIGQEAVNVAQAFLDAVDFTGVILSKLDGDARGGAALSVAEVTGRPIKFASVGEKLDEFEAFHPDRMAGRILGMGDVLTLIEKAEATMDHETTAAATEAMLAGQFTLEDFLNQLQQIKKMGPLQGILEMLPGVGKALKEANAQVDDRELVRIEAIIQSMTLEERRNPKILNGKRRKRISAGCGRSVQEINQMIKAYDQMAVVMKQMGPMMSMFTGGGGGAKRGRLSQMRELNKMRKELEQGDMSALSGDLSQMMPGGQMPNMPGQFPGLGPGMGGLGGPGGFGGPGPGKRKKKKKR